MKCIKRTYKTSEVAQIIHIHPNTVRMYEELGFIAKPVRQANGYRIFTDLHIEQFQIARRAFQIEVIQNGLRKKAIHIVKLTAACRFEEAIRCATEYINLTKKEIIRADEAVSVAKEILQRKQYEETCYLKRKEVSALLDITMDTLRNWEMNGLLNIKREANGYRIYTDADINRIKIIRTLRCANYSLSAILRMLNKLDTNEEADIQGILNTPNEDEDIISVCDQLISSLNFAKDNMMNIKNQLIEMREKY